MACEKAEIRTSLGQDAMVLCSEWWTVLEASVLEPYRQIETFQSMKYFDSWTKKPWRQSG
jgi:hypothetical protein